MSQTQSRPEFICHECGSDRLSLVADRDGTYQCDDCNERTHEKIERHRDDLEDLAETDLPISKIAQLLLGETA